MTTPTTAEGRFTGNEACPRCWHVHLDYWDEACVSCGCEAMTHLADAIEAEAAAPLPDALERLVEMLDDDTVYTTEAARDLDIAYEQHLAKCRALLRREVGDD